MTDLLIAPIPEKRCAVKRVSLPRRLDLIPAFLQARRVGALVALELGLLPGLDLTGGLGRCLVLRSLALDADGAPRGSASGCPLAGLSAYGAADGAKRSPSGGPANAAAALRGRSGHRERLRGIDAGLAPGPPMAIELVALELLLALPAFLG
jgi:hypothetical protein